MFLWNWNIHADSEFRLIIDINNCGKTVTSLWNSAVNEILGSKVESNPSVHFIFTISTLLETVKCSKFHLFVKVSDTNDSASRAA